MAYMFNEDKTKFPFVRDLLWSGNEEASTVAEWSYEGSDHGVTLSDYSEFEIVAQDGTIARTAGYGTLFRFENYSTLYFRNFVVNTDLNEAYVDQCYAYGSSTTHNDEMIPVKFYGIKVGETDAT